jgi:hypothetical protein
MRCPIFLGDTFNANRSTCCGPHGFMNLTQGESWFDPQHDGLGMVQDSAQSGLYRVCRRKAVSSFDNQTPHILGSYIGGLSRLQATLPDELLALRGAAYCFIAALSMMRDSQIREITRGAVQDYYGAKWSGS